jgi:putative Holliday junction resolvase
LRIGQRAAIDVGTKRVGAAICDREGILASPVCTVQRIENIQETVQQILSSLPNELLEIYVGLPLNLRSESTKSTEDALLVAAAIQEISGCEVRLIDERMTTALANSQLRVIGKSQKEARSSIDQMAAVAILEYALDIEKKQDRVPGITISEWRENNAC